MEKDYFASIVQTLPKEFTSHVFINAYIREFEAEYIKELVPKKGGFRELNSKIARFLSMNQKELQIQKGDNKVIDENILGNLSENASWTRIDIE